MAGTFRFSFGPWNIHTGADSFGPPVRKPLAFAKKLEFYRELGFGAVQFHDDDAVPGLDELSTLQAERKAKETARLLKSSGLAAEFVAPRLWESPRTVDGAFTSNNPADRTYARERCRKAVEIANRLETDLIVLWLAREGTYIREAKDSKWAVERLVEGVNRILACDPKIRIGVNIESAHAILAGLDPAEEMGFALASRKLFTVHLNDQNGLKFDQDKSFGSVDLRRALNQVWILDRSGYGKNGEWVGLDVKAMRTQPAPAVKHLRNSREIFLRLLKVSRGLDESKIASLVRERDYEELDLYIMERLLGK
ncbi:MAG: Xylose isomerase [candidate division TA06 bacterium ADurb.Bin417]|uniref:Xylose isomerase n=1 Tax=candidate division TA06 bacterium ADurb.Bin417 TaxID=1852828 RepID=A0A1V5MKA9_UNCT6|nr:MAG: Xylose isomerase [candidate division TA06 bacterium ADurb.Bin417]